MSIRHSVDAAAARFSELTRIPIFRRSDFSSFSAEGRDHDRTDMHRAFYGTTGSAVNKWQHYLGLYDRHLSQFRGTPFKMLEIGVWRGGSLRMWRKYFGPQATIFGIDIDPNCTRHSGPGQVRIGSQTDAAFLKSVVDEMGGVDVVIDDGSHVSSHQIASMHTLFPMLSEHGVYICEDTHTSYFGYLFKQSFVDHARKIVDDLYADFHNGKQTLPNASRTVRGLHFYTGMVVIEKCPQQRPAYTIVGDA